MSPERLLKHFEQISEASGAVPRLRRFILDLAVRGKLVEQNAKDEPAGLLVAQIQSERARRAKSGDSINAQASVESAVGKFLIPPSWKWVRLGFVTKIIMGQSPPGVTYNTHGEGDPLINGPVEFSGGAFGITALNQYTTAPTKRCEKGDLLLCVRGSTTGRTNVAGFNACIGRGVAALRPLYEDKFIRLFVWASREQIIEMGRGIAFPSVSRQQIEDLPTPLPPLAEQYRIVAKVDKLMALCDKLEAAQAKREKRRDRLVASILYGLNNGGASPAHETRPSFQDSARFYLNHLPRLTTRPEHIHQLRQTILNLAVRGKLVEQDAKDRPVGLLVAQIQAERARRAKSGDSINLQISVESIEGKFLIPPSWKWVRLGFVTNVIMGQSPPGVTYNTHREGDPLINGPVEFSEGAFGITALNQYTTAPTKRCKNGDLLLCVRGSTTGRTNVAGFDACIGRGVAALQPLYADRFIRIFVWASREQIIGMGRGIAFPSVSRQQIEDFPTPLPPLAEQYRIVARVGELMALCVEFENKLFSSASRYRKLTEAALYNALSS
jgi:type I restriction enzyme S subunit